MHHDIRRLLPVLSNALIAVIFLVSAVDKAGNVPRFEKALETQGLFPESLLSVVAIGTIVLEFLIAFGLMLRRFRLLALVGAMILLVAFILVLLGNVSSTSIAECGCGGPFGSVPIPWKIGQDIMMLILAAWTLYMLKRSSPPLRAEHASGLDTYSQ